SANNHGALNTATGLAALQSNTTGGNNTAMGAGALNFNIIGDENTAFGYQALQNNIGGGANTAIGASALFSNSGSNNNTAIGAGALMSNTSGANTAIGKDAMSSTTTGGSNTAIGTGALFSNTSGIANIALGDSAGSNLTTGNNNIDIGNVGVAGESGTIRIGNSNFHTATFVAGISGATASGGVAVFVNSSGKLGTLTSSARFKDDLKPMERASEAILALKPVRFRYKKEIDPDRIAQFGLVAEEVEKVNPDLVVRDKEGKPYSVRYDQVNAMLLNEFLKEHRKNEEQQATIAQLKSGMEALTAQLKEQAAQIQKVSAQLEASKPAPEVVVNKP
ncbi:MAG TPA: tail fiber domain-containing protein, partial [Gammaproteobacteria bacterium]|nr:tail fiber domain-containing protein [Gammaproteobacteria bacterium]